MSTSWMVDTAVMLSRLDSMEPAAAAADAAEIGRIIAQAEAVAQRLRSAFAPDQLAGVSARAAESAGASIAAEIASVGHRLEVGQISLDKSDAALAATVAYRPRIAALDALRNASASAKLAARTALSGELTGTYNGRMSETAAAVTPDVLGGSVADARAGTTAARAGDRSGLAGDPGAWQSGSGAGDTPTAPIGDGGPAGEQPNGATPPTPPPTSPGRATPDRPVGPGDGGPTPPPSSSSPSPAPPPPGGPGPAPGHPVTTGPVPIAVPMSAPVRGEAGLGRAVSGTVAGPAPGRLGTPAMQLPTVRPAAPSSTPVGQPASAGAPATGAQPTHPAGAGPRPGQAPYGPGPIARRSSDEPGHRPADYLRSVEEGLLVLGSQPLVGPSVIGWAAAAEPVDAVPIEGDAETAADGRYGDDLHGGDLYGDDLYGDDLYDGDLYDDDQELDPTL